MAFDGDIEEGTAFGSGSCLQVVLDTYKLENTCPELSSSCGGQHRVCPVLLQDLVNLHRQPEAKPNVLLELLAIVHALLPEVHQDWAQTHCFVGLALEPR
eukprot:13805229-Alexandrium_andersonii.AAC.1